MKRIEDFCLWIYICFLCLIAGIGLGSEIKANQFGETKRKLINEFNEKLALCNKVKGL